MHVVAPVFVVVMCRVVFFLVLIVPQGQCAAGTYGTIMGQTSQAGCTVPWFLSLSHVFLSVDVSEFTDLCGREKFCLLVACCLFEM